MENGEERRRVIFPSGVRVSETLASHWEKEDGFPWQDVHYHRGLTEHYLVQYDWVGFLFEKDTRLVWQVVQAGEHIMFSPGEPHLVLMGPGSVMVTTLLGVPVGNPDRNGEDWWSYDDYAWDVERMRIEQEHF